MTGGGNKVLVAESGLTTFFASEDAELRAATTAWLRANTPWEVVPADQVETVRVRALGGKSLKTGAACGGPTHAHDGYKRAFGSYDAADLRVTCGATCALELSVFREAEFHFHATVPSPVTIETVLRAVPELTRYVPEAHDEIGGLVASFGPSTPPPVRSSVKLTVWNGLAPDAFASVQPAIDACYRPGGGQEMLLLSVDARGRVDRCEGRPWNAVPSQECVCAALKKAQLPATAAGKRAGFDVLHEDRDRDAVMKPRTPPCAD